MKNLEEIHNYWIKPYDGHNKPQTYFSGNEKSNLILKIINGLRLINPSIIELGCNVGRNMAKLHSWHYDNISGVEISPDAVVLAHKNYPELIGRIKKGALEDVLPTLPSDHFDVVFTMAVLEHVHPDSESLVFDEMIRISKRYVITIEDEVLSTWRHFPRNYTHIFCPRGMQEIKTIPCGDIKGLGSRFIARIFKKK